MRFTSLLLATIAARVSAIYDPESFADQLKQQREEEMKNEFTTGDAEILNKRTSGTHDPDEEEMAIMDSAVDKWLESNSLSDLPTIQVPVVIHIIKETANSNENEVIGRVQEQLDVLNEAFDSNNSGFHFNLKQTLTHINRNWWKDQGDFKKKTRVGGTNMMNVWFNKNQYLGYATLAMYSYVPDDGIVINHGAVMGGSIPDYNLGDTLVHEVGHWLGLYHTFDGGCSKKGDRVDDTPREKTDASGCPIGRDTCTQPGKDPIHNYMDYTYDTCMYEFTAGQTARMKAMWNEYRAVDGGSPTPAPQSTPSSPTASPVADDDDVDCSDATLKIWLNDKFKVCSKFVDRQECEDNKMVQTHCPFTCDTCEQYSCVDSTAKFKYSGRKRTCGWLRSKSDKKKKKLCKKTGFKTTCRKTCGFCEG